MILFGGDFRGHGLDKSRVEIPSFRLSQILSYWIVFDTGLFDGISKGEVRLVETPSSRLSQILSYCIVFDTGLFGGISRVNNFNMPTIFFRHKS